MKLVSVIVEKYSNNEDISKLIKRVSTQDIMDYAKSKEIYPTQIVGNSKLEYINYLTKNIKG